MGNKGCKTTLTGSSGTARQLLDCWWITMTDANHHLHLSGHAS